MNDSITKNNDKSSFTHQNLESGFLVLTCQNNGETVKSISEAAHSDAIQFHFCVKGSGKLNFNAGRYSRELVENKSLLIYNPEKNLPVDLEVSSHSKTVSLLISIERFHRLFSDEMAYIDFLKEGKRHKKYYQEQPISPNMAVVLKQILDFNSTPPALKVYLKGKSLELIGLYFNCPEQYNTARCPFLADEKAVRKIKQAKEIIIKKMTSPPTLKELSEEIGLSLKKLKQGFKEVYGDTVFGFLFNYKMEVARKLLEEGQYNVNEVGLKIGYSTASHFIVAFKKKFGTTPKKYLQSISTG